MCACVDNGISDELVQNKERQILDKDSKLN